MNAADPELLKAFEDQLDPANPTAGSIAAHIVGYGEISTVFELDDAPGLVFKRMSAFRDAAEVEAYQGVIEEYLLLLREVGIDPVASSFHHVVNRFGDHSLYIAQEKVPRECLGNILLREADDATFERMLDITLDNLEAVWTRNAERGEAERIGIDTQISNWAFLPEEGGGLRPVYFDFGTPFIRRDGAEVLDGEVHLRSMPFFLVWVVRTFFLQDILDTYYSLRTVLLDLLGNFQKEGRADRIEPACMRINERFKEGPLAIAPIGAEEVEKYYKEDSVMWELLLNFRRFDRFVKTVLLRHRYRFILPGRVER